MRYVGTSGSREFTPNRSLRDAERRYKHIHDAKEIRRKFQDKEPTRVSYPFASWPKQMREVGKAEAEMYVSNKWKNNPYDDEDYKHVAEGPQRLMFTREFERGLGFYNDDEQIPIVGPMVEIDGPMPDSFAVLAPMLGLQCTFYEGTNSSYHLPRGDDGTYQINIPNAHVGAARHPGTGAVFLLIYSPKGLHCLITGDILSVEKDGIVG